MHLIFTHLNSQIQLMKNIQNYDWKWPCHRSIVERGFAVEVLVELLERFRIVLYRYRGGVDGTDRLGYLNLSYFFNESISIIWFKLNVFPCSLILCLSYSFCFSPIFFADLFYIVFIIICWKYCYFFFTSVYFF